MREIRTYRKNMTIYKLIVRDETDSCELVWYNQSYLKNMFQMGKKYKFYGKINKKPGDREWGKPPFLCIFPNCG